MPIKAVRPWQTLNTDHDAKCLIAFSCRDEFFRPLWLLKHIWRQCMTLTRRDFLKTSIAASTAATVGMPLSKQAEAAVLAGEKDWQWDKSVCRFCGTGCGIMVATKEGRIVATKGDPKAPVNRGLNCVKG
jgi:predicted molibdopterin-dependent oxidoreductase YjgC